MCTFSVRLSMKRPLHICANAISCIAHVPAAAAIDGIGSSIASTSHVQKINDIAVCAL